MEKHEKDTRVYQNCNSERSVGKSNHRFSAFHLGRLMVGAVVVDLIIFW